MSRRIGLSARNGAPPLLNTVGNKKRTTSQAPPALDDPPLSTDDEDELASEATVPDDQPKSPIKQKDFRSAVGSFTSDSDSSDDDRIARADIKPTSFTRSRKAAKPTDSPDEIALPVKSKRQRLSQSPARNNAKSEAPASSGEHLRSKYGFVERKQSKATYGRRGTSSQSSQKEQASSQPKSRAPTLLVPSSMVSPQKRAAKFSIPDKNVPSSPPDHWTRRLKTSWDSEDSDSTLSPPSEEPKKQAKILRKTGMKKAKSRTPSPTRAVFKMPTNFADLSRNKEDISKSEERVFSDPSSDHDTTVQELVVEEKPAAAICPWCGQEVDKADLEAFAKGKRMNVRMQTRFCQQHTRNTAKTTWQERGYPEIKWDSLESRFNKHHNFLLGIIDGNPSYFRSIHAKNVAEGKARSLKKEENLNPGYYGPRGFNVMCDYFVKEFSDRLKTRAVEDRAIAGRGSPAFIQSVLVPELGVRLIMDDMYVDEGEARAILSESKGLGELVHDAEN